MKAPDIPTDLLRTLVAVIDCESYTRAAKVLGCSQPTVSLHMQRLQRHAQGKLMLRQRKPVELTPLGTQLAGYARQILALHGELAYLTEENAGSQTVRVGLPTGSLAPSRPRALMVDTRQWSVHGGSGV